MRDNTINFRKFWKKKKKIWKRGTRGIPVLGPRLFIHWQETLLNIFSHSFSLLSGYISCKKKQFKKKTFSYRFEKTGFRLKKPVPRLSSKPKKKNETYFFSLKNSLFQPNISKRKMAIFCLSKKYFYCLYLSISRFLISVFYDSQVM